MGKPVKRVAARAPAPAATNGTAPQPSEIAAVQAVLAEGGLLALTRRGLVGWARDPAMPADPIDVVVLVDDRVVARVRADRFDEELVRSRVGPGTPGFVVRLTALPAGPYPIRLGLRDTHGTVLGAPLAVARMEDLRPAVEPAALADYEGTLDGLYGGLLLGWVWDRSTPDKAVQAELYDGGERVDRTTADMARDDLKAAGKRGGRCGFSFQLPAAMLDGAHHSLTVRVADTLVEVQGGPITFGPVQSSAVFDELARLKQEVARLSRLVGALAAPSGDFQRQVIRTLSDRVSAMSEVQREMIERELDALRRLALHPDLIEPGAAHPCHAANAAPEPGLVRPA